MHLQAKVCAKSTREILWVQSSEEPDRGALVRKEGSESHRYIERAYISDALPTPKVGQPLQQRFLNDVIEITEVLQPVIIGQRSTHGRLPAVGSTLRGKDSSRNRGRTRAMFPLPIARNSAGVNTLLVTNPRSVSSAVRHQKSVPNRI